MGNTAKKQQENVVKIGDKVNLESVKVRMIEIADGCDKLDDQIAAIQAKKQALREEVQALGFTKRAFDTWRKKRALDAEEKKKTDLEDKLMNYMFFNVNPDGQMEMNFAEYMSIE